MITSRKERAAKEQPKGSKVVKNKFQKPKKAKRGDHPNVEKTTFKVKYKTEICHYWELNGWCKFGEQVSERITVVCIRAWTERTEAEDARS